MYLAVQQHKPQPTPQQTPQESFANQASPLATRPPQIDFTALITQLANNEPPTAVTLAFRKLLGGFPNAVFSPYEVKVICAMIEPSVLLPTSTYYDPSIDGTTKNPADVSKRLCSEEFLPHGFAFVQEAVKAQSNKTSAAWAEHNEKLKHLVDDVWLLVKQREDGLRDLVEKHGDRHPVVQALKDAVVQEHTWLNACVHDNSEGYAKHCEHLERVKAGESGRDESFCD